MNASSRTRREGDDRGLTSQHRARARRPDTGRPTEPCRSGCANKAPRGRALGLALAASLLAWSAPGYAEVPAGFRDVPVASLPVPTALDFLPDGRLLVTTKLGELRVIADQTLLPVPALTIAPPQLCTESERGLLGVAVSPTFASDSALFLYYTAGKASGCVNRVARFQLGANGVVVPGSETVILDDIPSISARHNGGDIHFGPDGTLFIAVGDSGCEIGSNLTLCAALNGNARSLENVAGKILRVLPDGSIPADNPFAAGAGARRCAAPGGGAGTSGPCQEIYAYGLRNPFRMAFKPGTSLFHINDVGQATWEEINVGSAGADYGWNLREGFCATGSTTDCGAAPPGLTGPIFAYGRTRGCRAITGAAFAPQEDWPLFLRGAYLFGDFICGQIRRLVQDPDGRLSEAPFAAGLGSLTAMRAGPGPLGPALYYATFAGGGQIRRIDHHLAGVPTRADTDGDARGDVVFHNALTGEVSVWLAADSGLTDAGSPGLLADLGWTPQGTGDFDGDGRSDLLWRHAETGQVQVWLLTGGTLKAAGSPGRVVDRNWRVAAIGDLDGDGRADIFWHRPITGATTVWLMAGTTRRVPGSPGLAPGLAWEVQGAGDLDGDGKSDVLWREPLTGRLSAWLMNGLRIARAGPVGTVRTPSWRVAGLGDTDADGRADIVWHNAGAGAVAVWRMDGLTRLGGGSPGTAPDLLRRPVGVADLDGDGRADLLWRDPDALTLPLWRLDGDRLLGEQALPTTRGGQWGVVAPGR